MAMMAEMERPAAPPFRSGRHLYVRSPEPLYFPSEESLEEAVSETKRHLEARTTLYLLLKDALTGASIGSDQFLYWEADDPKKCLSPDVFVKLGSVDQGFDNWKVWERGAPELAVEIVSKSDQRDLDWEDKLRRYRASGIRELVRFDAEDDEQPIRVWDRVEEDLVERSPEDSDLRECVALGLWWAVVPSALGPTLRLARRPDGGELLPTPGEERVRLAEELAEERKARSEAEHQRLVAEQNLRLEAASRAREAEGRASAERERDAAIAEAERLRGEIARLRGDKG